MMKFLVAGLLLILFKYSFCNNIYISLNGDDQNGTGSIQRPFKTFNKAQQVATSRDTCFFLSGTYNEKIQITKPISIQGSSKTETKLTSPLDVLFKTSISNLGLNSISVKNTSLNLSDVEILFTENDSITVVGNDGNLNLVRSKIKGALKYSVLVSSGASATIERSEIDGGSSTCIQGKNAKLISVSESTITKCGFKTGGSCIDSIGDITKGLLSVSKSTIDSCNYSGIFKQHGSLKLDGLKISNIGNYRQITMVDGVQLSVSNSILETQLSVKNLVESGLIRNITFSKGRHNFPAISIENSKVTVDGVFSSGLESYSISVKNSKGVVLKNSRLLRGHGGLELTNSEVSVDNLQVVGHERILAFPHGCGFSCVRSKLSLLSSLIADNVARDSVIGFCDNCDLTLRNNQYRNNRALRNTTETCSGLNKI